MSIALERPIQDFADDLLDRSTFIERLGRTLVSPDGKLSSGVVLGICGEWGSGKSSLLNLLARHLREQHHAVVVQFDPWLISGRDDLVNRLLQQLAVELSDQSLGDKARSAAEKLCEYVEALSPVADAAVAVANIKLPGAAAIAKFLASRFRAKISKSPDIHSKRRRLEETLACVEHPIVVMIDELDRLEDSEIRAMAQLVRSVADFPQISYVLAYDPGRVAEALGAGAGHDEEVRINRGTAYLEKIVQYQIPLPAPSAAELIRLADQAIEDIARERGLPGKWYEQPDCDQLMRILIPGLLRTPRDIKRWSGLFAAQEGMFFGEVNWVDLLALSALMAKAPRTVENIRRLPEHVGVQLPDHRHHEYWMDFVNESKLSNDDRRTSRFNRLCASGEQREIVKELVGFIFPMLTGPHVRRTNNYQPDRLFRPRPFLTVLRYGIPPGHFSRADIVKFLSASFDERKYLFDRAVSNGTQHSFISRFSEIYVEPHSVDHKALWKDIAEIQRKGDADWLVKVPDREVSDEFARVLSRHAGNEARLSAQEITEELRAIRDREILPCVIHAHIWGHGLFGVERRGDLDDWLPRSLVEEIANEVALEFVRDFLKSTRALAATWHMYPYYIASKSGHWSKECRDAATAGLRETGFLDTLVVMMFGNRNKTSRFSINEMLDFDAFMISAETRMSGEDFCNQEISLQAAYASLKGRMPAD